LQNIESKYVYARQKPCIACDAIVSVKYFVTVHVIFNIFLHYVSMSLEFGLENRSGGMSGCMAHWFVFANRIVGKWNGLPDS